MEVVGSKGGCRGLEGFTKGYDELLVFSWEPFLRSAVGDASSKYLERDISGHTKAGEACANSPWLAPLRLYYRPSSTLGHLYHSLLPLHNLGDSKWADPKLHLCILRASPKSASWKSME